MTNILVKQRSSGDCGVACLAMFLKISYEEVTRRILKTLKKDAPINGLNEEELAVIIKLSCVNPVLFYSLTMDVPAIMTVPSTSSPKSFHYIYWDGSRIYDPASYEHEGLNYCSNDFLGKFPLASSIVDVKHLNKANIGGVNGLVKIPTHLKNEFDWKYINAKY